MDKEIISMIGVISGLIVKGVFDHMRSQKRERHSVARSEVTNKMIEENTQETHRGITVADDARKKLDSTLVQANVAVQASTVAMQASGVAVESAGQITREITALRGDVQRIIAITEANSLLVGQLLQHLVAAHSVDFSEQKTLGESAVR